MSKMKNFKMIMEKSNTNRVVILTNHYQIIGNVYECDECNKDEYVNLTNVRLPLYFRLGAENVGY